MIFSDEKEIVMNNLLVAVKHSIDHFQRAAAIIDDEQLTGLFEQLASDRREMADAIEHLLKASGFLPAEPDPEKQHLTELATRIRAAISDNDRAFLLDTADQLEKDIRTSLQQARGLDWPDRVTGALAAFADRLHANLEKIQAIR